MSRLTRKVENHHEIIGLKDTCAETCADNKNCSTCVIDKVIEKLADYEDKQEQGLLIFLPLKVGDVVYSYFRLWRKEDGIVPYQITNFTITQNKKGVWTKKYRAMWLVDGKTCDKSLNFSFDEIGKTVFLTRSEADEALAKMGGKE